MRTNSRVAALGPMLLVTGSLGCPEPFEPGPDIETGTSGGEPEDVVVFDGAGRGRIYPPKLRDTDLEPMPGDEFGRALTAGDFDRDGYDDLAIAAPGAGVGGSVVIVPGGSAGLQIAHATVWTQDDQDNQPGDRAGQALSWSWGRLDLQVPNDIPFLVIGAPGEAGVGAVFTVRLSRSPDGPEIFPGGGDTWFRDEIAGVASLGDQFGAVLMPARAIPR